MYEGPLPRRTEPRGGFCCAPGLAVAADCSLNAASARCWTSVGAAFARVEEFAAFAPAGGFLAGVAVGAGRLALVVAAGAGTAAGAVAVVAAGCCAEGVA